jgi:hypothetical protein
MAQPPAYTRQADFSDLEQQDPADGLATIGVRLDAEFDAVRTTLDAVRANLALLQRDDTELANRTVGTEQLKTGVSLGVGAAGPWLTGTAYAVNDTVWEAGKLYICDLDHTADTFATDLAAGKWSLSLDVVGNIPNLATPVRVETFQDGADFVAGTTTMLTLADPPQTEANTSVFFDGVYQSKGTYSLTGGVLQFADPIPLGVAEVEVNSIQTAEVYIPGAAPITSASAKEYGAVGDGVADDTLAIFAALLDASSVFLPAGDYKITAPAVLTNNKVLYGEGPDSRLVCANNTFDAVQMTGRRSTLARLAITGGDAAVRLKPGATSECTQNSLQDLTIDMPNTGIVMDGGDDPSYPCYWNNVDRVLIERPLLHGVHLTKTGGGDTPNANRLTKVRVFSKGAATTGHGFYVEHGQYNNALVDCEADMNGASAQGCFTVGPASNATHIVNAYAEGVGLPNVKLEAGSQYTSIINLTSNASGAAILDQSGGNYEAFNAGYPYKSRFPNALVESITVKKLYENNEYYDPNPPVDLDATADVMVHFVSSYNGSYNVDLPDPADEPGRRRTVKKIDSSNNPIIVRRADNASSGPDGANYRLNKQYDFVSVVSNGAEWFITSKSDNNQHDNNFHNAAVDGNTYIANAGTKLHLIAPTSAVTCNVIVPEPSAAVNRVLVIKRIGTGTSAVVVKRASAKLLTTTSGSYDFSLDASEGHVTIMSDGASWYEIGRDHEAGRVSMV